MALTKITPQMFDTSATAHDLNVDNGTFVVDGSASRVGIGTATPSTLLHVNGVLTATSIAGTLTTAAQTNITSLGTLTSLTVDDITIDGSTISDAGDFTIDVGGDINLDADGADIVFKDGGTQFGQIRNNSGLYFISNVVDASMYLRGNDGGSYVNAIAIDFANGGNVGIGTTTQSFSKLQVKAATDQHVSIFTNSKGLTIGGITDAGGSAALRIAGAPLRFSGSGGGASAGPHLEIDSSGNSTFSGDIFANTDSTHDIGTNATRFANAYFDTMYGTVGTAAQPNITSVGTLTGLNLSGNVFSGNKTGLTDTNTGHAIAPGGLIYHTTDGTITQSLNRLTDDGPVLRFVGQNTAAGSVGVLSGGLSFGTGTSLTTRMVINSSGQFFVGDGSPQWPTGTIGNSAGRHMFHYNGDAVLILWDESTGAQGNTGSLFLGGKPVGSSNYFSGGAIYGNVENGSNAAGELIFKTTNTSGGVATALTINSSQAATFAGTISSGAITSSAAVNSVTVDTGTLYVGNNNTELSENNLYAKSGGHFYIDHNTVGQDFIFRVSNSSSRDMYGPRFFASGRVSVGPDNSTTSAHQMKINSTTMGLRIKSGNGGYSALTFSGDNENTIGSITTTTDQIYVGSQNSGGTGSNGEFLIEPRYGNNKRVLTLKSTGNIHGPIDGGPLSFAGLGCFNIMDMEREWLDLLAANSGSDVTSHGSTSNVQGPSMSHPGATNTGYSKLKYADQPTGGVGVVLESTAGNASTWNGGWNSGNFIVDQHKPYLYTCYVRRTSTQTAGNFYFGLYNAYPQGTSTTVNTNPYFIATPVSSIFTQINVWYLVYCMVYPRNYSGTGVNATAPGDMRGIWRLDNMNRQSGSTGWRNYQDVQQMRSYLYYAGDSATTLQWARPGVWLMDGNQPTFGDLLNAHGIGTLKN